jgi:hypothetical protein
MRRPLMRHRLDGWSSVHARSADGTFGSVQRVRAARPAVGVSVAGAIELGSRYWNEAVRASHGVVRCRRLEDGVELRLSRHGPVLLSFRSARTSLTENRVSCSYPIRGGLLARRAGGALVLSQIGRGEVELRATVTGYSPRLGMPLGAIQRRVHAAISRRYFARLIAETQS